MKSSGKELKVTGLVALSDYSALFSDNGDMMFDAVKFSVAIMTEEGFETFGEYICNTVTHGPIMKNRKMILKQRNWQKIS